MSTGRAIARQSLLASGRLLHTALRSPRRQNRIDEQLAKDPLNVGESREGNRRILHEAPLGVIYSVNETDRTVLVLDVWSFMKRGDA